MAMATATKRSKGTEKQREHTEYLQRIRTFAPPPTGFNPDSALDEELIRRGFPRRPDPKTEPELSRLWKRAISLRPTWVRSELKIDEVLAAQHRKRRRIGPNGAFSPSGWGGAIVYPAAYQFNPPEKANTVYAEWGIPAVQANPARPNQSDTVGFWVGLDNGPDVLQAGSAATVRGANVTYWTWFEWYPSPPVAITNFPINPGDDVTVLVCATDDNHGFAALLNKTTNVATSVGIPPPPGITENGGEAEWIVEAEVGASSLLPNFGGIEFRNCTAGTKSHALNLSKAVTTSIAGASSNLTATAVCQPSTVLVAWEGST
jgi:Peptidase A4 family